MREFYWKLQDCRIAELQKGRYSEEKYSEGE
jgi:hypothetical protein